MKAYKIIFSKYYTEEHNECMELMIKRLQGVQIIISGVSQNGEKMLLANLDEIAYRILFQLMEVDCLEIETIEM